MLPEKLENLSLRKSWHVIIILLATSLAIASETSNFILHNHSIVLVTSQIKDDNKNIHSHYEWMWLNADDFRKKCEIEKLNSCKKKDHYLKLLLLFILFICAWRYWRLDNKNREILSIYREIFDSRGKNPDEEIDNTLKLIAVRRLKFHGEDRVSVYKYHTGIAEFIRIGRFSTDPTFSGGGAKQYSKDKGVISKAWKEEVCYIDNIPIFKNNQIRDLKDFLDSKDIGNFTMAELRNMRMKSRFYCAYTIYDSESVKTAVIVFESKTNNRFSERFIRGFMNSEQGKILKQLICQRTIITDMEPLT